MLCPRCHRLLPRNVPFCANCGVQIDGGHPALELVLADGTRVPLVETISIGRSAGNDIQLADRSVSRSHARVAVDGEGVRLEDAGSSHGTLLDGHRVTAPEPLHAGARIRLGDVQIGVEARADEGAAGRTIVVRPGESLVVPALGTPEIVRDGHALATRPRVRSGWALKRLAASEGERRFVLRDLRGGDFMRMTESEAALFERLDGRSSLVDLVADAEQRLGPSGPGRLMRLLADLGEHGLLEGVAPGSREREQPHGAARLLRPRERSFASAPHFFERAYARGGFLLFTAPALTTIALVALGGAAAFVYLVAERYGTPFVVASRLGLGGLTFLLGRFLVVALHETAHGLTMASFGRRVSRAGLKLLLVFPYAFVDTSEAWFEPRRRRIAVAAAGPVSDAAVGGAFALACLAAPAGTTRDILFQLAFAAYVGAILNLNPFLDRDGYHILVDVLNEPGLRRRSREELARRLSGRADGAEASPVLLRYAVAAVVWSLAAAGFAIALSLHYYDTLVELAPKGAVIAALAAFWTLLFVPVLVTVLRPLVAGRRRVASEVRRVRL